jgi:hypothetical protein
MDKHDTIARKGGNVMSSQSGETHEDANAGCAGKMQRVGRIVKESRRPCGMRSTDLILCLVFSSE